MSSDELARAAGINERYAREWCLAMACVPVLDYDVPAGKFTLKPDLIPAFMDPGTLAIGASTVAALSAHDQMLAAYRSGEGIGWGEHHCLLYEGTRRFFAQLYEGAPSITFITFIG